MSNVSRAVYQKVAEENKRLKRDLYIMIVHPENPEAFDIKAKWREKFKKDVEFQDLMRDFAKQYREENPQVMERMQDILPPVEGHWERMGERYGYPKCCIDSFCSEKVKDRTENQQLVALLQTGFIPCPAHADKIIAGEIAIISLINNRDLSIPRFPMG